MSGFKNWKVEDTYNNAILEKAKSDLEGSQSTDGEEYKSVVERLKDIESTTLKDKRLYAKELEDMHLLRLHKAKLEKVYGPYVEQQPVYVYIEKHLAKLIKKAKVVGAKMDQLREGEDAARKIIDKWNPHYISTEDKVYYYDPDCLVWRSAKVIPFCRQFAIDYNSPGNHDGIRIRSQWDSFEALLSEEGRIQAATVCTFKPSDGMLELNLLSYNWLEPKKGEVDPWNELLMTSVTGCTEAKNHLEQCIVWKYLHPEDYELPAQSIYGVGGAGKNKLRKMIGTIFGMPSVVVVGFDDVFGSFNGLCLGKAVIMVDENVANNSDANKLKRTIGNETIIINSKYGVQGQYDNTAWWFVFANGSKGSIPFAGDKTDRRYSTYKLTKDLFQWVSETFGTHWDADNEKDPRNEETAQLYQDNEWRFSDPELVAHYLNHLLVKWKDLTHRPKAFHQEDYDALLEIQKDPIKETLQHVFDSSDFEHIEGKDLYEVFKLICKDRFPGRKNNISNRQQFYAEVEKRLSENPEWRRYHKNNRAVIRVRDFEEDEKHTTGLTFSKHDKTTFKRNTSMYLGEDRRGFPILVEKYENKLPKRGKENLSPSDF